MTPERRFLFELALMLHRPVRELENTMSLTDLLEWGTFLRLKNEEAEDPKADLGAMTPEQIAKAFGARIA